MDAVNKDMKVAGVTQQTLQRLMATCFGQLFIIGAYVALDIQGVYLFKPPL